ncbi:MAG: nitroreductase family protein [Rhodothermaceae bacterium]
MEFYKVIENRRSIRDFSQKEVEEEKISRILDAGIKAPSYNHKREWDFMLIKDPGLRKAVVKTEDLSGKISPQNLKNILFEEDNFMADMYLDAIPKQKSMLLQAPELLIVVYKPKTEIKESQNIYDLNCFASVWCCIENILLAITEEDLYGVTYIPQRTVEMKSLLNIPKELEIAALIPFGQKADLAVVPKQKEREVEKHIHINKWGETI